MEVLLASIGTLSSGKADGDGDAKTREKTRERMPLWWGFANIKQHRRDRSFGIAKLLEIIYFRPVSNQDDFIQRSSQSTFNKQR